MNKSKHNLLGLLQNSSLFGAENNAAHVDAHVPPTCRLRSAHIAAFVAAHVCSPEHTERIFPYPTHMIAYPQKIAPQKASWRFLPKVSYS